MRERLIFYILPQTKRNHLIREANIVKAERNRNTLNIYLTLALLLGGNPFCAQEVLASDPVAPISSTKTAKAPAPFATVGDAKVTWREYREEYNHQAKNKFFHGKPSDEAVAAFQREVGNKLVDDILLTKEAKRRKLKPNDSYVNAQLQKYDRTFANDPNWPEARKRVLPVITKRLQGESLRIELETLVRNVPPPTTAQLKAYFDAHPDKFTSPPQPKVSVILIRVDPSSLDEEWNKATEEAKGLVKRLRAGEDFAKLAREYSGDITAENGGDMGFLHTGMLGGLADETVGKLQPGETSDPVRLLEGMAILRLTDRIQPPPLSFEAAQPRARELWLSEQSDLAWSSLKAKLRKQTPIHIDESRFLPLPAAAEKPVKNSEGSLPAKK